MSTPRPLEFVLALEDFDRELLPPDARRVGSERFEQSVITHYQRQFAAVGGSVHVDMDEEKVYVVWTPDPASRDPFGYALEMLQIGELGAAVPLLENLTLAAPGDADVLYNLGMAYSDLGRIDEAVEVLSRLVDLDPENANASVALGVAHQRRGETGEALEALRTAISLDPANRDAHRNLGGVLAALGELAEAEPHLQEAARLDPGDQQAIYGLAATLEKLGGNERLKKADDLYGRAMDLAPASRIAELARQARSKMAQESFREAVGGSPRMDAVMYCLDALESFNEAGMEKIQAVTLEIALLGRQGLDTNDPTPKYKLKSLPGSFTGLRLVSIMYVGFKQLAPDHDVGFDLDEEYATARGLFVKK